MGLGFAGVREEGKGESSYIQDEGALVVGPVPILGYLLLRVNLEVKVHVSEWLGLGDRPVHEHPRFLKAPQWRNCARYFRTIRSAHHYRRVWGLN